MPHHTHRTITTKEEYSSNSSSDSQKTVSELNTTQVYTNGLPQESSNTGQISNSQTNVGLFQTVNQTSNNRIEQNKAKETCCDCFLSFFGLK